MGIFDRFKKPIKEAPIYFHSPDSSENEKDSNFISDVAASVHTESKFLTAEEALKIERLMAGQKEVAGFTKVASGSSRDVYAFRDDKYVVKIERGEPEQNAIESKVFREANSDLRGMLVPIVERDSHDRWIVQPKVETAETMQTPKLYRTFNTLNESLKTKGISVPDFNPKNIGLLGNKPVLTDYGFDIKYTKSTDSKSDFKPEKPVGLVGFFERIAKEAGFRGWGRGDELDEKELMKQQWDRQVQIDMQGFVVKLSFSLADWWKIPREQIIGKIPRIEIVDDDHFERRMYERGDPSITNRAFYSPSEKKIYFSSRYMKTDIGYRGWKATLGEEVGHFVEDIAGDKEPPLSEFFGGLCRLYVAELSDKEYFGMTYKSRLLDAAKFDVKVNKIVKEERDVYFRISDLVNELNQTSSEDPKKEEIKKEIATLETKLSSIEDELLHILQYISVFYYYTVRQMTPEERHKLITDNNFAIKFVMAAIGEINRSRLASVYDQKTNPFYWLGFDQADYKYGIRSLNEKRQLRENRWDERWPSKRWEQYVDALQNPIGRILNEENTKDLPEILEKIDSRYSSGEFFSTTEKQLSGRLGEADKKAFLGQLTSLVNGFSALLADFWGIPRSKVSRYIPGVLIFNEETHPKVVDIIQMAYNISDNEIYVNESFLADYDPNNISSLNSLEPIVAEEVCHFMHYLANSDSEREPDMAVSEFFAMISRMYIAERMNPSKFSSDYKEVLDSAVKFSQSIKKIDDGIDSLSKAFDKIFEKMDNIEGNSPDVLKAGVLNDVDHLYYYHASAYYYEIKAMDPQQRLAILRMPYDEIIDYIIEPQLKRLQELDMLRSERLQQRAANESVSYPQSAEFFERQDVEAEQPRSVPVEEPVEPQIEEEPVNIPIEGSKRKKVVLNVNMTEKEMKKAGIKF
jgi:hypothetical protein